MVRARYRTRRWIPRTVSRVLNLKDPLVTQGWQLTRALKDYIGSKQRKAQDRWKHKKDQENAWRQKKI